jgi:hypothetical protein
LARTLRVISGLRLRAPAMPRLGSMKRAPVAANLEPVRVLQPDAASVLVAVLGVENRPVDAFPKIEGRGLRVWMNSGKGWSFPKMRSFDRDIFRALRLLAPSTPVRKSHT